MEKKSSHKILWFSAVLVITIIFGTMYVASQQVMREDANDPQIQLAEDTAAELNSGEQPSNVVSGKVDINNSLAPFVLIYNKAGTIEAGNGYLDGVLADGAPYGTMEASASAPYTTVTWSPYSNLKIASVSVTADNYYVFSGRSLAQVGIREKLVLRITALGWIISILILIIAAIHTEVKSRKKNKVKKTKHKPSEKTHKQKTKPEEKKLDQPITTQEQGIVQQNLGPKPIEVQSTPQIELQQQHYIQVRVPDSNDLPG